MGGSERLEEWCSKSWAGYRQALASQKQRKETKGIKEKQSSSDGGDKGDNVFSFYSNEIGEVAPQELLCLSRSNSEHFSSDEKSDLMMIRVMIIMIRVMMMMIRVMMVMKRVMMAMIRVITAMIRVKMVMITVMMAGRCYDICNRNQRPETSLLCF